MARALNILGLLLTLVGAAVTAWGVFISPQDAEKLTGAAIGTNPAMNALLVGQSLHAAIGLALIGVGTMLQLAAQILPMNPTVALRRNDAVLLLAFGLCLIILLIGWFSGSWPEFWKNIFGQTMAAWVQVGAVFLAVRMTGAMTQKHADAMERARVKRQLASTTAVIGKALQSLNDLDSGVLLKLHGDAAEIARDPFQTIYTAHEALTPMRIHELPDAALVMLALDIKAGLGELAALLMKEDFSTLRLKLPQYVKSKVSRSLKDCEDFITYADSGKWQ